MNNFEAFIYNTCVSGFLLTCSLAAMIITLKSNRRIHELLDEEK